MRLLMMLAFGWTVLFLMGSYAPPKARAAGPPDPGETCARDYLVRRETIRSTSQSTLLYTYLMTESVYEENQRKLKMSIPIPKTQPPIIVGQEYGDWKRRSSEYLKSVRFETSSETSFLSMRSWIDKDVYKLYVECVKSQSSNGSKYIPIYVLNQGTTDDRLVVEVNWDKPGHPKLNSAHLLYNRKAWKLDGESEPRDFIRGSTPLHFERIQSGKAFELTVKGMAGDESFSGTVFEPVQTDVRERARQAIQDKAGQFYEAWAKASGLSPEGLTRLCDVTLTFAAKLNGIVYEPALSGERSPARHLIDKIDTPGFPDRGIRNSPLHLRINDGASVKDVLLSLETLKAGRFDDSEVAVLPDVRGLSVPSQ